jgi:hypothetical protein
LICFNLVYFYNSHNIPFSYRVFGRQNQRQPNPQKAQNPPLFIGVFFGAKVVQKRGRLNEAV